MNPDSLSWDYPAPFTQRSIVLPEDIDGLEHTNNTVYVKWCEQVAWAHSVSLGLDLGTYRSLDRAMAITHSEYHYLQASRAGDEVVAGTWIVSWDNKLTMQRRFSGNPDQRWSLPAASRYALRLYSNFQW